MTISTLSALAEAFVQKLMYQKSSISNQTTGAYASLWRAGTSAVPAQGATPGAAAVCDSSLTGALTFTNPPSGARSYVSLTNLATSNIGGDIFLVDRLAHMGGLDGTVTTAQTVNVDVSGSTSNLANRRGASNYSDVLWWLEWYTDTGSSAVNASVAVTYDDASTDTIVVALSATMRASRILPIFANTAGRYIKSVQSVTLSGTTGTAGSFGVTALRVLSSFTFGTLANFPAEDSWQRTGMARVHDSACLSAILLCVNTVTGTMTGFVRLVQG